MNIEIKERFIEAWAKYFPDCDLPIACFYTNELNNVEFPKAPKPNAKGVDPRLPRLVSGVQIGKRDVRH